MTRQTDNLIRASAVAKYLGVSKQSVFRWAKQDKIRWESPDGTTSLWRHDGLTWRIWTGNPQVGQRLARLSKANRMLFSQVVGGYLAVYEVPWMKFSTQSLANALAPACRAGGPEARGAA